jgi:methylenetetrahydrofolate--tRNA-(uracil-5-)-methyltransferase
MVQEIELLAGEGHLSFYDAMAPVIAADSIDMTVAFRANRRTGRHGESELTQPDGSSDYINCPLNRTVRAVQAINALKRRC